MNPLCTLALPALTPGVRPVSAPLPAGLAGHYDPRYVLLSVLLAIFSAYAALDLAMRLTRSQAPGTRMVWLGCGGVALGSGIWSMHFIGMLAFRLPVPVTYDLLEVALSLLLAILASAGALFLATRVRLRQAMTLLGSVCLGLGICSMHYLGMAAMRMAAMPVYSSRMVAFSVVLAVGISWVALRASFSARVPRMFLWRKLGLAVVLGAAIPCVHYVGMFAATWQPMAMEPESAHAMIFSVWGVLCVPAASALLLFCMARLNGAVDAMFLQQQAAQRTSEQRYRRILGAAFDAFIGISPQGIITDWNEQAAFTFGWPAQEALGRSVDDMLHFPIGPGDADGAARTSFTRFLEEHTRYEVEGRLEVEGRHRSGVCFPAEMALSVIEVDGGLLVAAFVHDVTERKLAEQQTEEARRAAEAANQAKSEFLANMSHEIRTPLNGIIGMNDLVLDTVLTAEQRECLETVRLSADLLLSVISDILDFSKIEAGRVELEHVAFDLRDCLETTLKTLAFRAEEKGLELLCDIALDVPEGVCSDPARIRQVLTNLVGNAIKFTQHGEIAIRVERAVLQQALTPQSGREWLQFTVRDTGIGIAADKLTTIFDAFRQADTSTTRQFGGTGLGLTISRRLVEMLGGRMWVESEPGHGSEFHFALPVELAAPLETAQAEPRTRASLAGVKTLIIDDNRTNRRILEGLLGRWRMPALSAADGPSALRKLHLEAAAGEPFQLVLTDMHMPEMDGFTFVQELKRCPQIETPTVMMLSSGGHHGDTARCAELGIAAYLLKPVRQAELQQAIAVALRLEPSPSAVPQAATRAALAETLDSVGETPTAVETLDVLLAEDNEINRRLALRVLERRGHRVTVAHNGREALERMEERLEERGYRPFDLLLMDVQMPVMGGIEATLAIRARERERGGAQRQRIVAMTALVMKGDRERCLQAEMDGYLSKPFRPDELDAVLNAALEARRSPATPAQAAVPAEQTPLRAIEMQPDAAAVLDERDLLERVGGDTGLLAELYELFREDTPERLAALGQAVAHGDAAAVRAVAHSLKGALANLAAAPAAALAAELEAMGVSGSLGTASACLDRLRAQVERVERALGRLCASALLEVAS